MHTTLSLILDNLLTILATLGIGLAYIKGRGDGKRKQARRNVETRLQSVKLKGEINRNVETQDDAALIDRLSR